MLVIVYIGFYYGDTSNINHTLYSRVVMISIETLNPKPHPQSPGRAH